MATASSASPGTPTGSIAPNLVVPNGPEAIAFYQRAFDATELYAVPDAGVAELEIHGSTIWLATESEAMRRSTPNTLGGRSVWMILTVPDPDAVWEHAVAGGAEPESPVDEAHGWRIGTVLDPWGHRWEIGRPLGEWPPPR